MATSGNNDLVVVDGKEDKEYDSIGKGSLIFSSDSKQVAYVAQTNDNWFVVVDGKVEKKYDGISKGSLIFDPDSKHIIYVALSGSKWFVVIDQKEEKEYDSIVSLGGGKIIFDTPNAFHYLAVKGSKIYLVNAEIETNE